METVARASNYTPSLCCPGLIRFLKTMHETSMLLDCMSLDISLHEDRVPKSPVKV